MRPAALLGVVCALFATSAHAWFFFVFPVPRGGGMQPLANEVCVGPSVKVGDKTDSPKGWIEVTGIVGQVAFCANNPTAPILAKFSPVAPPAAAHSGVNTIATSAPAPQAAPQAAGQEAESQGAARLRELARLLRDGVITQDDFDSKKAEILKSL